MSGFRVIPRSAPPTGIPRPKGRNGQPTYTPEFLIAEIQAWARSHDGRPPRVMDWHKYHARRHGIAFEEGWPSTMAVQIHFGSWAAGIEAAGFEAPKAGGHRGDAPCVDCGAPSVAGRCYRCGEYLRRAGKPWTPGAQEQARKKLGEENARAFRERFKRLADFRRQGLSNREIAEREGVSPQSVADALSQGRKRGWDAGPPAKLGRPRKALR